MEGTAERWDDEDLVPKRASCGNAPVLGRRVGVTFGDEGEGRALGLDGDDSMRHELISQRGIAKRHDVAGTNSSRRNRSGDDDIADPERGRHRTAANDERPIAKDLGGEDAREQQDRETEDDRQNAIEDA
jgi:hypothetical protein